MERWQIPGEDGFSDDGIEGGLTLSGLPGQNKKKIDLK
jgi:hypothetical protein